jgi:hypothetical protein
MEDSIASHRLRNHSNSQDASKYDEFTRENIGMSRLVVESRLTKK